MSLILEALKKSEAERQRQSGPTVLEVRVARPQRRYPIWARAVVVLLVVNMLLLLLFVLRRPATTAPASAPPTTATAPMAATAPAVATPAAVDASARAAVAPTPAATPQPAGPVTNGASDAAPTLADDSSDGRSNPADEQPAIAQTAGSVKVQRDNAGDYSNLPSFGEVGGNLPDFRLDLHAYAERPRDRYALINMHAVHEGDSLPEGARVLAITREGVVLDYQGQQFMLRPQQ
jgi:general secretion pathway protein B